MNKWTENVFGIYAQLGDWGLPSPKGSRKGWEAAPQTAAKLLTAHRQPTTQHRCLHWNIFQLFTTSPQGLQILENAAFLYLFLEVMKEKVKRPPFMLFGHINSSQCKEKGSQWFQIQNKDRLFWQGPNYRALQAQTQRDTFQRNSIFLFNSKRESQAKKTLTAFHKLIWFQQLFGAAHIQTTIRPLGFCPGHVSLFQTGEGPLARGSPTWRKDRESPTFLLYGFASHYLPPISFMAQTAEPSQRPGSYQSMTGLDFAVHFGGPSLQACTAIEHSLLLHIITIQVICRTPSLMSPDSLSTNNCWMPAVYSSIRPTAAPNTRLIVSGSTLLNALFPKLFIMVLF